MSLQHAPNLEDLSDDELRAACVANGWEKRLERQGCTTALALAAVSSVLVGRWVWARTSHSVTGSLGAGVALFVLGSVLLAVVVDRLGRRRRAPYRAELRRRLPHRFDLEEARAAFAREAPPDWVLVQETASHPHGGLRWSRVDVWPSPPRAVAETRSLRFRDGPDAVESAEARIVKKAWHPTATATLVTLLEEEERTPRVPLDRWCAFDGMSCSLVILKRDPYSEKTIAQPNLSGTRPERDGPPALLLLYLMVDSTRTP